MLIKQIAELKEHVKLARAGKDVRTPHEVVCVCPRAQRSGSTRCLCALVLPQVPVKEGKAETKEDRQKVAHLFAKSPSVESLEARIKTWKVKLRKLVLTMKNKVTTVV